MAEKKNTKFSRPGGYAQPKGATQTQRKSVKAITEAEIKLYGDSVPPHAEVRSQRSEVRSQKSEVSAGTTTHRTKTTSDLRPLTSDFFFPDPDTQLYIGDCRDILANLPEKGHVDLIFADPPFNWEVPYAGDGSGGGGWKDGMPRAEYERFTFDWLDGCIECLAPHGSLWVNIPDDTAAEAVLHLKRRGLTMINWCIWHFRFGQNRNSSFIMSKVHVLYFAKLGQRGFTTEITENTEVEKAGKRKQKPFSVNSVSSVVNSSVESRIWNPNDILEVSDRASIYADQRTMNKDSNKGLRVPMDVWYGKYWGRIQGNNKERRHEHHNQIPEIYLERVIKACSNPVPGWSSNGITTEITENTERERVNERTSKFFSVNSVPSVVNPGFGSLVLDPFCGSGTTSTVARALGRRSITIEYSEVNAKSAWERITNVGMVEREDAGKPQSTAIFKSRRKTGSVRAT